MKAECYLTHVSSEPSVSQDATIYRARTWRINLLGVAPECHGAEHCCDAELGTAQLMQAGDADGLVLYTLNKIVRSTIQSALCSRDTGGAESVVVPREWIDAVRRVGSVCTEGACTNEARYAETDQTSPSRCGIHASKQARLIPSYAR